MLSFMFIVLLIVQINANWCQDNNKIVCTEMINCKQNGWKFIDDSMYFLTYPFNEMFISIKCDIPQNVTIISALNFSKFYLELPNSKVTILFDSFNINFTTTINLPSLIITDKSIPYIYSIPNYNFTKKSLLKGSCDDTCDTCENDSCFQCLSGYYLNESTCNSCPKIHCDNDYCSTTDTSCSKCLNGYYLNESICKPCTEIHCNNDYCSTTDDSCSKCLSGYYLDDLTCEPCSEIHCDNGHCSTTDTSCSECLSGYTLNESTCVLCSEYFSNCVTCSTTSYKCDQCSSGYYVYETTCEPCTEIHCNDSYCSTTDNSCSKCLSGYYLNESICEPCSNINCVSNSESCSTTDDSCSKCLSGYYLDDLTCKPCSEIHCNNDYCSTTDTSCSECLSGYTLNEPTCVLCSEHFSNCVTCSTTSYKCDQCSSGYYVYATTCEPCTEIHCNDSYCSTTDNSCFQCLSGYYLNETTCKPCTEIHCNDSYCSTTDTSCSKCLSEYTLNESTCVLCSEYFSNCVTCSTTSYKCDQCLSGYYLSGSICEPCSNINCVSNSESCSTTDDSCSKCLSGYYLDDLTCKPCSEIHCNNDYCSTTDTSCSKCLSEYTLNESTCVLCSEYFSNCVTCSTTSYKCDQCSSGYYVYETTCKLCHETNDNCEICSDGNTCTKCYSPYIVSNGKCVICESNEYYLNENCNSNTNTCNEQINSTTCISCNFNNYLYEYECISQNECITPSNYGCDECSNEEVITTNGTCLNCLTINSTWKYCIIGNNNNKCLECNDNYHLTDNGNCESISSINHCSIEHNSLCYLCENGYYLNSNNECVECKNSCSICNYLNITNNECLQCNESILTTSNECRIDSNCISIDTNECIKCNDGYYINNGECIECNDNCKKCNSDECILCYDNYLINYTGSCQLKETFNCLRIDNGKCISCENGYNIGNTTTNPYCDDYLLEYGGCSYAYVTEMKCIECSNNYIQFNGTCYDLTMKTSSLITTDSINDNCKYQTSKGCIKCNAGYYLESGLCYECSNGCATCYNSTMCLGCNSTHYINSNYGCSSIGYLAEVCTLLLPSRDGCAVCDNGYYKESRDCIECDNSCETCINPNSCVTCNNEYYRFIGETGLCTSYSELTNCLNKTSTGCKECANGTYLKSYECYSCNSTCLTCSSIDKCYSCADEYVLINDECIHYTTIEYCIKSKNSRCTRCSGTRKVKDGIKCEPNKILVGITVPVSFIIVIIVITIIIIIIFFVWQKKRVEKKERKNVTVFKMWRSNVIMERLTGELCSNLKLIEYEGEIGVNEEARELICVGNLSKHQLKIQISTREGCDKYEIRTNPQMITIKKGEAVEFEIFIKPLCTCKIDDQIVIIALDIHKGEELNAEIGIKAITEMTTRLDYDELIENKKLGEGSFGIVYKGTFRGNEVAIKKMKEAQDTNKAMDEFSKEVAMLDKFRNDYIVHFYGAVFIPTKICMVTEFAQYGSLQDLINRRKDNLLDNSIKMKILLDAAKGISYLHSNGILHRDIKPDNFLVLSLEDNVQVNAKLTDFGASRNVNMLMTNMTFTKGIGTPKYMAPEILDRKKYKKPADIFSFAITLYETITWGEAYPKSKFRHPWNIADFVTNGERLPITDAMNGEVYELMTNCWKQDPKERHEIEQIIKELEEMN